MAFFTFDANLTKRFIDIMSRVQMKFYLNKSWIPSSAPSPTHLYPPPPPPPQWLITKILLFSYLKC